MNVVVVARGAGRWPLPHGSDPGDVLAEHGLVGEPVRAVRGRDDAIEVHYDVTEHDAPPRGPEAGDGGRGAGRCGEGPGVLQRVAAYALVVDEGRLLMSQLSHLVRAAAGLWTLPGGGIERGEEPLAAVVREVHEETGQHVLVDDLVQVQSTHRVGPRGGECGAHEDFHAVRLIHRAHCPRPGAARVVELDGSTGAAAWVPLEELPDLPLAAMVREALPVLKQGLGAAGAAEYDLL